MPKNSYPDEDARGRQLYKDFGLTYKDYDDMLEKQDGVCAICGGHNSSGKALSVDHCHSTGKIRGLLCLHCNVGLGYFRDNPMRLLDAVEYLERV
jgi:hypothetical protein